jgi:hypothetical protein
MCSFHHDLPWLIHVHVIKAYPCMRTCRFGSSQARAVAADAVIGESDLPEGWTSRRRRSWSESMESIRVHVAALVQLLIPSSWLYSIVKATCDSFQNLVNQIGTDLHVMHGCVLRCRAHPILLTIYRSPSTARAGRHINSLLLNSIVDIDVGVSDCRIRHCFSNEDLHHRIG